MSRKRGPIALRAYEKLARRYAALVDEKAENAFYEMPAMLSLLPHVGGKRVLDAGCGPGRYAEWLADRGAEVVGLDVSPAMIRLARRRVGKRAEFRVADLGRPLDFLKSGSFDLVIAPLVMDHIEDWRPLFGEFNRVLKGFGLLVFSCGHPFADHDDHPDTDYFAIEYVVDKWRGFGVPVAMPSYRRPLAPILEALAETGFAIENLLEPCPGEEVRRRDPEAYEKRRRLPSLIVLRARKTTG